MNGFYLETIGTFAWVNAHKQHQVASSLFDCEKVYENLPVNPHP